MDLCGTVNDLSLMAGLMVSGGIGLSLTLASPLFDLSGIALSFRFVGAPNTIRTCGLSLRRGMLYPAELPGQAQGLRIIACCSIKHIQCFMMLTRCGSRQFDAGRTIAPI